MTDLLINGLPRRDIDSRDRGLQYGDGFFTTMRVVQGQPQLWERHVERLEMTSQRLGIEIPHRTKLLAETRQVSRGHGDCAVRLSFTRGVGGRGYAPPDQAQVTRLVSRSPLPEHYALWRQQGIRLVTSSQRLGYQPMLQGLKTLNRLEQVLLKQELAALEADDLLVLDDTGNVCETSAGNLFWRQGDTWFTSDLARGGIAGVVRAELLANNPVTLVCTTLDALRDADEIFVCNALCGLIPVHTLDNKPLPAWREYPAQLATRLEEDSL
ncbi:aminodeoxychorismate lyase [Aliidiomarina sp. Khilg15.8]